MQEEEHPPIAGTDAGTGRHRHRCPPATEEPVRARRPTTSPELAEIPAHLPGDDLAPHRPHRTRRSQTAQPPRTTGAPAGSTRPDTPPARTSRARHTAYGLHPDRRIDRHRTSRHSGDRATATQRKESTMTPTRTRKSLTVAAGMATAAALALAACSSGGAPASTANAGSGSGAGDNSGYTFAMVTHETPGDTFWDKIKAGATQAAKNSGITLKYSNDPDPAKQATLIQNAVDSKVDGIATTLATPDALAGAVKSANDA